MLKIDREPTARIALAVTPLENSLRPILLEAQAVFKDVVGIGRNRIVEKVDWLKLKLRRSGRSRRCGSCRERHSSYGEQCQQRGLSRILQFNPLRLFPSKLSSLPSGLYMLT